MTQRSDRELSASQRDKESELELTPHDRKELSRLVRKYGRNEIIAEAKKIPLPGKRGRPRIDPEEAREFDENIAEFISKYAEMHRAAGSKKAVEDAFRDLYNEFVDQETQRQPGHFDRWLRTLKRRRSNVRLEIEAALAVARETARAKAEYIARNKKGARINRAKKSRA